MRNSGNKNNFLFKIVFGYLFVSALWIYFSDLILAKITSDPTLITRFAMVKGWLFVIVTTTLLYGLIKKYLNTIWLSQKSLQESEEHFRDFYEKSPLGYQSLDAEGRFLTVNQAWLDTLGYSKEEVIGKWFGDFLAPEYIDIFRDRFLQFKALGSIHSEYEMIHKYGQRRYIVFDGRIAHDPNGDFKQTHCVLQDITDRKQVDDRSKAFAELGHKLNTANTPKEAAFIIMEVADKLLGWDACALDTYSPEKDMIYSGLAMDTVNGIKGEVPPAYSNHSPSPMAQRVIKEGAQLILRSNPNQDIHSMPFGDSGRLSASLMFVRIHRGDRVIGIISIQSYTYNAYTEESLKILQSLADHCSGALDRMEAQNTSRIFAELGYRLSSVANVKDAIKVIVDTADELIGWDACTVDFYLPNKNLLYHILSMDLINGKKIEVPPTQKETKMNEFLQKILNEGGQLILRDTLQADPEMRLVTFGDTRRLSASLMYVPIHKGDKVIGIISIQSYIPNAYTADDLHTLQGLTDHFSGALERIQGESDLKKSEELYRKAITQADAVPYQKIYDPLSFEFLGEGIFKLTGYSATELTPQLFRGMVQETIMRGDALNLSEKEAYQLALQGDLKVWRADLRILLPNGESRWITDTSVQLFDYQNKPYGSIGILQDITDRKRTEESLRESEANLRAIFESSIDAIGVSKMGFNVYTNPAYLKMFGFTSIEELKEIPLYQLHAPSKREMVKDIINRRLKGKSVPEHYESRGIRKDGTEFDMELYISTYYLENQLHTLVIIRDITERKQAELEKKNLEEQLLQSQKMEAIGQLAGGIAHDFNNILTVIINYSESVLEALAQDNPLRNDICEIQTAGERAAALTHQLLAFARKTSIEPQDINTIEAINNLSKMLRRLIGEHIELQIQCAPDTGHVYIDPAAFEQIIINLSVNARDAMPGGGKLIIATKTIELDEKDSSAIPNFKAGHYIELMISDTGEGIPEEIQERVFEPFFTTKPQGKGTGLGLSVVYGAVIQNQGHIEFKSNKGIGTTFRIVLPASGKVSNISLKTNEVGDNEGQGETILVVEDEAAVRKLLIRLLTLHSYQVTAAENGNAALTIYKQNPEGFDLVITDMVMPGMGGVDLADLIWTRHPNQKIIFASGYNENMFGNTRLLPQDTILINKPFDTKELLKRIRQVLDSNNSE